MSELPSGWVWASPDDVAAQAPNALTIGPFGSDLKVSDYRSTGVPLVFVREIRARCFGDIKTKFIDGNKAEALARHYARSGDVLITKMGDPPGDTAIYPRDRPPAIITADCIKLTPNTAVTSAAYLCNCLRSDPVKAQLLEQTAGVAQQKLSLERFRSVGLPLAPLPEQKRIVDKLDALLARVDACRERLDRVPAILKRFRQSVLAAATSGELTREWREAQGRTAEWQRTSVADVSAQVFDGPFGSHLKSNDYVDNGVRVVRLENIAPLRFIAEKRTYIAPEKYERLTRHTLFAGDILFSSFVDEEVRVCLLPDELDGKAINKADCFCIRTNPQCCRPTFLALRLACRSTFEALDEVVHGATRPRINLGQLREITFDLPSLDEQDEILRRSRALLDLADALEVRLGAARECVAQTVPSALAKAFRGELVAQDPDDEPASELLAQVRSRPAAPSASGKPKRGEVRGPRTKAAKAKTT